MSREKQEVTEELLLRLLRPAGGSEPGARPLLERAPDWDYLIRLAERHRVVPALSGRLAAFAGEVPEQHVAGLRRRARSVSFTNLALTGKLLRLLALLRERDIPAIPYKGPALAQSAYGDIGLRQFTDLDILVRKRDVYRIKELLVSDGCRPAWLLTPAQEAAVLSHYYEYPFLCNDTGMLVEIHWEFAERFFSFGFDLDQIWERSETVEIQGRTVPTLSPEDSLLVLCAHGSKHFWGRLSWVCDVAQTVSRRQDLDWEALTGRSRALGLRRVLWLGLFLASELLGAELPAEVGKQVRSEPRIRALAERIRLGLFKTAGLEAGQFRATLLQLSMRERVRDKFNHSFRLLVMTKLVDSLFMPMGRPR